MSTHFSFVIKNLKRIHYFVAMLLDGSNGEIILTKTTMIMYKCSKFFLVFRRHQTKTKKGSSKERILAHGCEFMRYV